MSDPDGGAPGGDTDRRESPRREVELLVRDLGLGGSFVPYRGNLGLGGAFFDALHPPQGSRLELRMLLAGEPAEVRVTGEVLRVTREGARFGAHVKFVDVPVEVELAIARFLERAP